MPRDVGGTYTLPPGINPVITDTPIASNWANPTLDDVALALTESVWTQDPKFTDPVKFPDGTNLLPAITWTNNPTSGWFLKSAGVIGLSINTEEKLTVSANDMALNGRPLTPIVASGRYLFGVGIGVTRGITSVVDGGLDGVYRRITINLDQELTGIDTAFPSRVTGRGATGNFPLMQGLVEILSTTQIRIGVTIWASIAINTGGYVAPDFNTIGVDITVVDTGR